MKFGFTGGILFLLAIAFIVVSAVATWYLNQNTKSSSLSMWFLIAGLVCGFFYILMLFALFANSKKYQSTIVISLVILLILSMIFLGIGCFFGSKDSQNTKSKLEYWICLYAGIALVLLSFVFLTFAALNSAIMVTIGFVMLLLGFCALVGGTYSFYKNTDVSLVTAILFFVSAGLVILGFILLLYFVIDIFRNLRRI